MEILDLILTPFYLILFFVIAKSFRDKYLKDSPLKKYFIPGLAVKVFGAISAGLIYQFYYGGGDTFNYFFNSSIIWEAFKDSPIKGMEILFATPGEFNSNTYEYTNLMYFYHNPSAFYIVKFSFIFGLFCLHTYSVISIFFSLLSFTASWMLFKIFYEHFPSHHKNLAIAILFLPSVVFWGSGLFKDTITFSALLFFISSCYYILFKRKKIILNSLLLIISVMVLVNIRGFFLLAVIPCLSIWVLLAFQKGIRNYFLKILLFPLITAVTVLGGYSFILMMEKDMGRYSIDNLEQRVVDFQGWHKTASERDKGAGYTLGETDFTPAGILKKVPAGINTALFRPYLWEVGNIVMLVAAIESLIILFLTIRTLIKVKFSFYNILLNNPILIFSLLFALLFAFAVGFTSYNFGALVRYKIPCMPFYVLPILLLPALKKELTEKENSKASTVLPGKK